jgi:acyl-CoA dehydrogenase
VANGLAGQSETHIAPLSGGQSNPTYRVRTDRGTFVLRKKPSGPLLPSAHAIDREFRVMNSLERTAVPVPRMLAWCDDVSVIGTPFYLMEFLGGRVFMDPSLPGAAVDDRRAIYYAMNGVIAALHAVDVDTVGLRSYGRTGEYVARQVARWSKQCAASTVPLPQSMNRLMEWLPQHLPAAEECTLVHGDYRLDNLVFHPTEPRVIGVLDWELSTLGDPVADFAYHCMAWRIPADLWRAVGGLDLGRLGIPREEEYVRRYEESTGRDVRPLWDFYMAFNLFRMAAILHGIAQRAADGTASAPDAAQTGAKAAPLADLGWDSALRHAARKG